MRTKIPSIMNRVLILFLLSSTVVMAQGKVKLIVRADDIGSSHAANVACIESYQKGIARSVEVMVPCAWFLEAAKLLRENPRLDVGVHVTLTSEWSDVKWRPLTCASSLVDSNGYFYPRQKDNTNSNATNTFWDAKPDMKEVEQEIRAQIEMAMKHIPQVTHISGHMGVLTLSPEMNTLKAKLEKDYGLELDLEGEGVSYAIWKSETTDPFEKRETALIEMLESLKPGIYFIVEHPGKNTPEMRAIGHPGYEHVAAHRDAVTRCFTSEKVKQVIDNLGIELIAFKDIQLKNE